MAERGFDDLSMLFRVADFVGIPYDPVLPVLNTLYGDPDSLEGEAARLRKIQSNIRDTGELLGRNLIRLKLHWSGDACAAFETYVTSVTERLDYLNTVIERTAAQLAEIASNLRMMWALIAAEVAGAIGLIIAAVAAAKTSGGFSLLAVVGLVAGCLSVLAVIAHEQLSAFDAPRREIATAHAELQSWAAGGASSLFDGSSIDSSEWLPR